MNSRTPWNARFAAAIGLAIVAGSLFTPDSSIAQERRTRQWMEVRPFILEGVEVTPERPGPPDARTIRDGQGTGPFVPDESGNLRSVEPKMVGAEEVLPQSTGHPYFDVVALVRAPALCTGVVVGTNAVLTAAHCVCQLGLDTPRGLEETRIVFGYRVGETSSKSIKISKSIVLGLGERFCTIMSSIGVAALYGQDLAVLLFDQEKNENENHIEFVSGGVQGFAIQSPDASKIITAPVARIATTHRMLGMHTESLAAVGFGLGNRADHPDEELVGVKLVADIPILSRICGKPGHAARFGCAPGREVVLQDPALRKDSCNGDSGGPAFALVGKERFLVGITSRSLSSDGSCGPGGIYSLVTPAIVDRLRRAGARIPDYDYALQ